MSIEIKNNEIYVDGKRILFPRDSNFDWTAPLFGISPSGKLLPISIDEDGKLQVNVTVGVQEIDSVIVYDYANTVAKDTETTILTYTNGSLKDMWLDGFVATGNVDARYSLYINNTLKIPHRTSITDVTAKMNFTTPIKIVPSTIIDIKVIHWWKNPADFEACLLLHRNI